MAGAESRAGSCQEQLKTGRPLFGAEALHPITLSLHALFLSALGVAFPLLPQNLTGTVCRRERGSSPLHPASVTLSFPTLSSSGISVKSLNLFVHWATATRTTETREIIYTPVDVHNRWIVSSARPMSNPGSCSQCQQKGGQAWVNWSLIGPFHKAVRLLRKKSRVWRGFPHLPPPPPPHHHHHTHFPNLPPPPTTTTTHTHTHTTPIYRRQYLSVCEDNLTTCATGGCWHRQQVI